MGSSLIVTDGFANVEDRRIYYKVVGDGAPLIILHGGPVLDHSYLFDPFKDLAREYKLIFFDQIACGKSSIPEYIRELEFINLVKDLRNLAEHLNLEKYNLLGHSWGCLLAVKFASLYPDNLLSVILSNPMPLDWSGWKEEQQILDSRIEKGDLIKRARLMQSEKMVKNPSLMVEKLMRISFKPHFFNDDNIRYLELNIPDDYLKRSEYYEQIISDNEGFDLYGLMPDLNIPVLTVFGENEPGVSLTGNKLKKYSPDISVKIIKRSGHFPFVENPRVYFNTLSKFLERVNS